MILRPYQNEAVAAPLDYFTNGGTGNPLIGMPTGTGKSLVIAELCRIIMRYWPRSRLMCLTHVKELITQNANELKKLWPQAPIGIFSAALGQRDHISPIVFGGVMSVKACVEIFGYRDILFIDEAHLLSPDESTVYREVIRQLKIVNPNLRVIGFSATLFRLAQGMLTDKRISVIDGHSSLFTDIVYDICNPDGFDMLIANKWLAPPHSFKTTTELNVKGVKVQGGEFVLKELQKAVDDPIVTRAALAEFCQAAYNREAWLIFCSGVEHSDNVEAILAEWGFPIMSVTSKNNEKRDRAVELFLKGELRGLCNNNILTTGFNHPVIDAIAMMRPTMSPTLWVQMLGRGTRPFDDIYRGQHYAKQNCLVLDFAGNSKRLGPIDDPRVPNPKTKTGGDAPIKICERCGCYNHIRVRFCANCGSEFEFRQKLTRKSDTADLLSNPAPQVEFFDVKYVSYQHHTSKKGLPSIKVTYHCGINRVNEFIDFEPRESGTMMQHMAHEWWRQRSAWPVPMTNQDALSACTNRAVREPKQIRVKINGSYPELLSVTKW